MTFTAPKNDWSAFSTLFRTEFSFILDYSPCLPSLFGGHRKGVHTFCCSSDALCYILIAFFPFLSFSFLYPPILAEATIGCPIPDLRFVRPRKIGSTTTEQPYVTFETTQIYLPDDFTTADFEYVEHTEDESTETDDAAPATNNQRQTRYTDFNPYAWNTDGSSSGDDTSHIPFGTIVGHESHDRHKNPNLNTKMERRKMMRKNAAGRRRLDRHHQGHKQQKREIINDGLNDIYYIQSSDIVGQLHGNLNSIGSNHNRAITVDFVNDNDRNDNDGDELRKNGEQSEDLVATAAAAASIADDVSQNGNYESPATARAIKMSSSNIAKSSGASGAKKQYKNDGRSATDDVAKKTTTKTMKKKKKKIALQRTQNTSDGHRIASEILNNNEKNNKNRRRNSTEKTMDGNNDSDIGSEEYRTIAGTSTIDNYYRVSGATDADAPQSNGNSSEHLHRYKRKSGKATGALGRPKGGSESGTKNTSRKKDGKCFVDRHTLDCFSIVQENGDCTSAPDILGCSWSNEKSVAQSLIENMSPRAKKQEFLPSSRSSSVCIASLDFWLYYSHQSTQLTTIGILYGHMGGQGLNFHIISLK